MASHSTSLHVNSDPSNAGWYRRRAVAAQHASCAATGAAPLAAIELPARRA
jgi:hypothetical protein